MITCLTKHLVHQRFSGVVVYFRFFLSDCLSDSPCALIANVLSYLQSTQITVAIRNSSSNNVLPWQQSEYCPHPSSHPKSGTTELLFFDQILYAFDQNVQSRVCRSKKSNPLSRCRSCVLLPLCLFFPFLPFHHFIHSLTIRSTLMATLFIALLNLCLPSVSFHSTEGMSSFTFITPTLTHTLVVLCMASVSSHPDILGENKRKHDMQRCLESNNVDTAIMRYFSSMSSSAARSTLHG